MAPALVDAGGGLLVDEDDHLSRLGLTARFGDAVDAAYTRLWDADRLRAIVHEYTWARTVDRLEALLFDD